MKVYITPDFINDLRESGDLRFIRSVLNHTLNDDGTFRTDTDDHQYHGIKDAWIRYVSRKRTAFRVIYLQKGDSIYLYRAGMHNIETRLQQPQNLEISIPINRIDRQALSPQVDIDMGMLLKTYEPTFLSKVFRSMYHVKHNEIILISPFISPDMVARNHHFGNFLDKAVEEDTEVTIVTKPPESRDVPAYMPIYKDLSERCIFIYFRANLHAKLYIFNIDPTKLSMFNRDMKKTAILGSSNLTKPGISLDDEYAQDELCYRLPTAIYQDAYEFAMKLINRSEDYYSYILRKGRN